MIASENNTENILSTPKVLIHLKKSFTIKYYKYNIYMYNLCQKVCKWGRGGGVRFLTVNKMFQTFCLVVALCMRS